MLEGQKEASGQASSRNENRRETWCPGAQGGGKPSYTALSLLNRTLTAWTVLLLVRLASKCLFPVLTIISMTAGAWALRTGLTPWRRNIVMRPNAATVLSVFSHPTRAGWLVLSNSLCEKR